ncbi:acyltransferase family protein [Metabacillus elymi]|uniref:Acyltransferase family protein n=1 Tax=Metabacillus elymi TaxID=2745198 RepID=A0ABX6SCT3_9BACI|nr:acyltransferase family protein [Metabacillus sp. KUDC1714]QNF30785.1 acyltransferase family protein [Metabacillus sp. KUDC1714]
MNNISKLISNRFWTLLVPYFSAGIFSLFFTFLLQYLGRGNVNLNNQLFGILYGNGEWLVNIPVWFLVCLFCSQVVFCFTYKHIQRFNIFFQTLFYLLLGIIGFIISKIIYLPWGLDIALVSQLFLFIGYKFKEHKIIEKRVRLFSSFTILLTVIFMISILINPPVDMNTREYNNIILFYLGGISGSILVLKCCVLISPVRSVVSALKYIGRDSLIILSFHFVFGFITVGLVYYLFFDKYPSWYINWIFSVLISLLIGVGIKKIPILNILFYGKKYEYSRFYNKKIRYKFINFKRSV